MSVYTKDIHFANPGANLDLKGAKDVEGYWVNSFKNNEALRHNLVNIYISDVTGTTASGRAYVMAMVRAQETGKGTAMGATYHFKFALVDGKWRISEQTVLRAYMMPEPGLDRPLAWLQWK